MNITRNHLVQFETRVPLLSIPAIHHILTIIIQTPTVNCLLEFITSIVFVMNNEILYRGAQTAKIKTRVRFNTRFPLIEIRFRIVLRMGVPLRRKTIAAIYLVLEPVNGAPEIDYFEDFPVSGNPVEQVVIFVIKEFYLGIDIHDVVGMEVVVGEMECFLERDEGHDDLH